MRRSMEGKRVFCGKNDKWKRGGNALSRNTVRYSHRHRMRALFVVKGGGVRVSSLLRQDLIGLR